MATLKDIARETGLNAETVSRIINNRGYISDEAREKVREAMIRLNYRPNEIARSLSLRQSNTLGLIVPHVEHPYFAGLIGALEDEACRQGQQLFLFSSRGKEEKVERYIAACLGYRVRGILLCSVVVSAETIEALDMPVVTIECRQQGAVASVVCENEKGGRMAAEHLIARGCRSLAHLGGSRDQQMPANARNDGFVAACKASGVPCVESFASAAEYRDMDYYAAIGRLLDTHPDIDGLFVSSDLIAAQTLQVCAQRGIDVPGHMRVIGFDDASIASLTTPPLSTIAQPIAEMARLSIEKLLEEPKSPSHIDMPVRLVVRGSS